MPSRSGHDHSFFTTTTRSPLTIGDPVACSQYPKPLSIQQYMAGVTKSPWVDSPQMNA